jgi:hypothetical protein
VSGVPKGDAIIFHVSRGIPFASEEARKPALSRRTELVEVAVEEKRALFPKDIIDSNYSYHSSLLLFDSVIAWSIRCNEAISS